MREFLPAPNHLRGNFLFEARARKDRQKLFCRIEREYCEAAPFRDEPERPDRSRVAIQSAPIFTAFQELCSFGGVQAKFSRVVSPLTMT